MKKVAVTKEVAEAIKNVRTFYTDSEIIVKVAEGRRCTIYGSKMPTLVKYAEQVGIETLMRALVIGYEVEKTPEENLREYYEALTGSCDRYAVKCTLDILGITIEGINA